MKKLVVNALIVLVFLVGAALVCYPTVSNWYNQQVNSYYIQTYQEVVDSTPYELYETMLDEARAYNATLTGEITDYVSGKAADTAYIATLDVSNGMIGAIEIDSIGISLPIYHGTDEGVLQSAVGHLEGSALPTGTEGEHTVLTGHTGLPSATLLTNLSKLSIGDTFCITVLNQVYTYEIYNILVVEPYELDALAAVEGKSLATLITCTPYGINSHRLLVQGELTGTETVSTTLSDAAADATADPSEASDIPTCAEGFVMMYATALAEGIRAISNCVGSAVQALQGITPLQFAVVVGSVLVLSRLAWLLPPQRSTSQKHAIKKHVPRHYAAPRAKYIPKH